MNIYVEIWDSAIHKELFFGTVEFKVETSFTPNDLWFVGLNESKDSIADMIQLRKVQQVLIGKVPYKEIQFDVQLGLLCGGNELRAIIINAVCHSHDNMSLTNLDSSDLVGNPYIFDFEELRTFPQYKGKTNIECLELFINNKEFKHPYNTMLNVYDIVDGKIKDM